jgi:hypothetical protein
LEFRHIGEKDLAIARMVTGGWSIKWIQAEFINVRFYVQTASAKLQLKKEDGIGAGNNQLQDS